MFTLVYINGNLNRPDTLPSFLRSNVGKSAFIQIDCVTPFQGTDDELAEKVCGHLSNINSRVEVKLQEIMNVSTEVGIAQRQVNFMVLQIQVTNK